MSHKPGQVTNCAHGVCNPRRTQNLMTNPQRGEQIMVELNGPGVFLAAEVVKGGGDSGLTSVQLDIDGRNVTGLTFIAAENGGFTQYNPYGIVLLRSNVLKTLTIGFPSPLRFDANLKLIVNANEDNVENIVINVIHGTV